MISEARNKGISIPIEVLEKLKKVGVFRIWGSRHTALKNGVWRRLRVGDIVIFVFVNGIGNEIYYGFIIAKVEDPMLSRLFWNDNKWSRIYFISDFKRCDTSLNRMLDVLGYQQLPPGPILVKDERVKDIMQSYKDIKSLIIKLCSKVPTSKRGFNPDKLFLPEFLSSESVKSRASKEEKALYLYGVSIEALEKIITTNTRITPELLWNTLTSFQDADLNQEEKQRIFSALKNDLRRLCIISIGSKENWDEDIEAIITVTGKQILKCIQLLRRTIGELSTEFIGSLPIIYCLLECYKECFEEAGVCSKLCKGEIDDNTTFRLVSKALEITMKNMELLLSCLPYGTNITVLKETFEKLNSSLR